MTENNNHVATSFSSIVFWLGLAFIITHEIDAVTHAEWRLLPLLNTLADDTARDVYILAHVPLFTIIFCLVNHTSPSIRKNSRIGVDLFLVVHVGLHWLLPGHTSHEFAGTLSSILIYGGALMGMMHLISAYWKKA